MEASGEKGRNTYPVPNFLTTRCTIGMSLSLTLYTTTSPTSVSRGHSRFHSSSRSPRWNAGSMDPESTTTMGEGESAIVQRPFHIFDPVSFLCPF